MTPREIARSSYRLGYQDGLAGKTEMYEATSRLAAILSADTKTTRLYRYAYQRGFEAGRSNAEASSA